MEECNYDELASTINIEDISSDELNQEILRRLKDNDPSFDELWICSPEQVTDMFSFCPDNWKELGWLGYFIGRNTFVNELHLGLTPPPSYSSGFEGFRRGMGRNKSIQKIGFNLHRLEGRVIELLDQFFNNNNNLTNRGG